MSDLVSNPLTYASIITVLSGVIAKLYLDGKSDKKTIIEISEARVNDLKEINAAKDGKDEKVMTLVQLIYNKLESEKNR